MNVDISIIRLNYVKNIVSYLFIIIELVDILKLQFQSKI